MAGWFELRSNDKSQWSFVLKAGNGETILTSEMYEARASAENGISSVQKNAAQEERYDRKVATNGSFYFTLKAANHQVIGNSQMYKTERSREDGVASVKNNGISTTVKVV